MLQPTVKFLPYKHNVNVWWHAWFQQNENIY